MMSHKKKHVSLLIDNLYLMDYHLINAIGKTYVSKGRNSPPGKTGLNLTYRGTFCHKGETLLLVRQVLI